jgi:hypothetical protein
MENEVQAAPAPATKGKGKRANAPAKKAAKARKSAKTSKSKPPAPRKDSNKAEAIRLLSRANGATLPELMKKFDWLPHTTRGFISILGKEYKIESTKVDGVRTYRIK